MAFERVAGAAGVVLACLVFGCARAGEARGSQVAPEIALEAALAELNLVYARALEEMRRTPRRRARDVPASAGAAAARVALGPQRGTVGNTDHQAQALFEDWRARAGQF